MKASPIADLSYRNYEGPLLPPVNRWWAIARATIRETTKKKSYWVLMAFAGWYYVAMVFVLFFLDKISELAPHAPGRPSVSDAFFATLVWKDQFLIASNFAQLLIFCVALLVGAGAIANDNRANALVIYLSRPCSKGDYVIGKWLGVFLSILAVYVVPAVLFFAYAAMSYRSRGFLSNDPWMLPKALIGFTLESVLITSLVLGVSSMFKQGRLAGATLAGLYFLSNFFTQAMVIAWQVMSHGGGRHRHTSNAEALAIVKQLFYASIDGIDQGILKAVLNTDGSPYFNLRGPGESMVPAPNLWLMLGIVAVISLAGVAIAWRRVRAVEVVG